MSNKYRSCLRVFKAWLLVNAFFVLPFFAFVLGCLPTRLEIALATSKDRVIKIGHLESGVPNFTRQISIGGSESDTRFWVYFNDAVDTERMVFSFDDETIPCKLKRMTIRRYGIWLESISGNNFIEGFKQQDGVWIPRDDIASKWQCSVECGYNIPVATFAGEGLLLLLCVITLRFKRNDISLLQSLVAGFSASVVFCLVIPAQSYLANAATMSFTPFEFICEAALIFIGLGIFLSVGLHLSQRYFGKLLIAVVGSLVAYEYLETGILSASLPPLTGDLNDFGSVNLCRVSECCLLACFLLPILFYRWMRVWVHWIALAVAILGMASLFDVKCAHVVVNKKSIVGEMQPKIDVARNATASSNRNVMVFVLDTFPSYVAEDVVEMSPGLKEKFVGFTAYDNNIGMGPYTETGMTGLMTGEYYDPKTELSVFRELSFTRSSFIAPYIEAGHPVTFIPLFYDNAGGVLCNVTQTNVVRREQQSVMSPFSRPSRGADGVSLRDIVRFRMTPFRFKVIYLVILFRGVDSHIDVARESILYPILKDMRVDKQSLVALHIYHTQGCHPPIAVDQDGHQLPPGANASSYASYIGQGCYVLRRLAELFDKFKTKGIYDNSTIIICSDHGGQALKDDAKWKEGEAPVRSHALLWIKPAHSHTSFSHTCQPTSHSKIKPLLTQLMGRELSAGEIAAQLTTPVREYREYAKIWMIDAKGNAVCIK